MTGDRRLGSFVVVTGGLGVAILAAASADDLAHLAHLAQADADERWRATGILLACLLLLVAGIAYRAASLDQGRTFRELLLRVSAEQQEQQRRETLHREVLAVMEPGAMHMVFQPITEVGTGRVQGYEALARFPEHGPDHWFPAAEEVGLGTRLELRAIELALATGLPRVPADQYVSVNLSATTLLDPALLELIDPGVGDRVVVELTEHSMVAVYDDVVAALPALRARGVRLAIDDLGVGYGSMGHVVRLSPDLVKIDRSLITGISVDNAQSSFVAAMVAFTAAIGVSLLAEGVETEGEAQSLHQLGVGLAQGWHFGRPSDLGPTPEPARAASPGSVSATGLRAD
ncbi:EAL domain-containing protein [Cellulomonas fimi]|uniref:EAL domain-containing protein n=1 Tax=Cellulomonas fimi TaxID=1708 RepID=A0A7Y0LW97_CELFI|nr:EAL domain-containing protein [Cellulomonas fimi]NMR19115.1 EAL domain-containing protein [Cellulomonas fimi]